MLRTGTLFLVILHTYLFAQTPSKLDVISVEQGLSQGFVPSIAQDDDGFLWFATNNGLNRYDGYDFQVFRNDPFDSLSLANNQVVCVAAAGDFLVVVTAADQLCLLHRKTQRFYRLPLFFPTQNISVERLFSESKNAVWVAYSDRKTLKIARMTWAEDLAERLTRGERAEQHCRVETVASPRSNWLDLQISADRSKMWLLDEQSVSERDLVTGTTRHFGLPPQFSKDVTNHYARIMPDSSGTLWLHQTNRIFRFDGQGWQQFVLPFAADYFLSFADHRNGLLWIGSGTEAIGIDAFKTTGNSLALAQRIEVGAFIRSGFSDRFGNLWLGTDARGVRKFNPRRSVFQNYLPGVSVFCPPVFDGKKNVLLGDLRRRDYFQQILDLSDGKSRDFGDFGIRPDFPVRAAAAENGFFWLFAFVKKQPQLIRLDPATGQKDIFPAPPETKSDVYILRAVPSAGEVWIFGNRQSIRFDVASRRFTIFEFHPTENAEVSAAERNADGSWWLGTTHGLRRFEPKGSDFRLSTIVAESNNRNSLPTNFIKSLLLDPADPNILWIGTAGQGLTRFDWKNNQFSHFTTRNGLPDDVVYGILAEDFDPSQPRKLWLSTNRGLARFSPETRFFQYFTTFDGLPDNEFNSFAAFKSPGSRTLLFGGVNGLTVFDLKNLTTQSQPPEVRLTNLKINGVAASPRDSSPVLTEDIAFTRQIELPFSSNNLMFSFAATDLTTPQRNQFMFYLEGAEREWAHQGFEHTAQYLNLLPGDYTFRVKAANSNGVWCERPIALKIKIRAPWYRSQLAYLLYVAACVGAVFWLYRNQLRQRLEHAEAERLKGLDSFKSRFFTNITHEFRTPLTVILGMTEQLAATDEGKAHALNLIKRNGENLLRLINQILDLAKLEDNSLKINYVQGDVLTYLRYIAESLHSLANAQNLLLRIESEHAKIMMDYDPERLRQVVHNLLSNAIKFTPSGGRVVLRADVSEHWLSISVADSGVGIPAEALPQVFDRFFQAKNQETSGGTGIGLSLTRELVRAMGGEVSVESPAPRPLKGEPDSWPSPPSGGAVFTVKLPISNQAKMEESKNRGFEDLNAQSGKTSNLKILDPAQSQILKSSAPQILIIEDNPDVVEYLSACLRETYQLDFAYNGHAGIEKALERVPDLVISDVMMPGKDGFEVCDFLKNDERTSHIPVVLLTAKADVESRLVGLRRGADAYLAKPFHREELLLCVRNLLETRQKLRERYSNWAKPEATPTVEAPARSAKPGDLEDAFFQKFSAVLAAHFADPNFSLDVVCRELAMSRTQVYRKLTALTGRSAVEHIQRFRLEKARELLLAGGMNVSEVAFSTGFNDPKYFSRVFAETFGLPPSEVLKG